MAPYVSDWTKPGTLVKSLGAPFWGSLKPTGDFHADFRALSRDGQQVCAHADEVD